VDGIDEALVAAAARDRRTLVLPVPERGEIYIRFGDPAPAATAAPAAEEAAPVTGAPAASPLEAPTAANPVPGTQGFSPEVLRELVRGVVREEVATQTAPIAGATVQEQVAAMEARLAQRIEAALMREPAPLAPPVAVETAPAFAADPAPLAVAVAAAPDAAHRLRPRRTRIYSGADFGDPTQLLVGGRVNLGPVLPGSGFSLVPSAAVGLGGRTSVLVAANLQVEAGTLGGRFAIEPHLAAGVGLLRAEDTRAVVNLGYGASALVGGGRLGLMRAFAEHQGIALFGRHRILAGLQLDF
jgi:hypothetical protein